MHPHVVGSMPICFFWATLYSRFILSTVQTLYNEILGTGNIFSVISDILLYEESKNPQYITKNIGCIGTGENNLLYQVYRGVFPVTFLHASLSWALSFSSWYFHNLINSVAHTVMFNTSCPNELIVSIFF